MMDADKVAVTGSVGTLRAIEFAIMNEIDVTTCSGDHMYTTIHLPEIMYLKIGTPMAIIGKRSTAVVNTIAFVLISIDIVRDEPVSIANTFERRDKLCTCAGAQDRCKNEE